MKKKELILFGGTHPTIYHPFVSALIPSDLKGKTILDIGCGRGMWGYMINILRDVRGAKIIGLDLNEDYLSFVRKHKIYTKLIKADLLKKLPIESKSVDFIICSEVIEHIVKKDGEKLLKEIDRIIKPGGRIIVTTPNVWLEMPYVNDLDLHRSLWNTADFTKRGYKVHGIGVKLPFNKAGIQAIIIQSLYFILTPFSYLYPPLSGLLIAVKDVKIEK